VPDLLAELNKSTPKPAKTEEKPPIQGEQLSLF
jgi:hypothetical protein